MHPFMLTALTLAAHAPSRLSKACERSTSWHSPSCEFHAAVANFAAAWQVWLLVTAFVLLMIAAARRGQRPTAR